MMNKFKDQDALQKAYESLEKEFTRRSQRLREMQGKIEQGTLIELPCKLGDTVYETDGVIIYEHKIDRIIYVDKMLIYDTNDIMFDERAIGVSVFLTREEAEKRLRGLQGAQE